MATKKTRPHVRGRPHPQWRERLLAALRESPNVTLAAKKAGVGREHVYDTRRGDPEFAAAMEAARVQGVEAMEDVGIDRAINGWDEPVYQGGELVGYVKKIDNVLLIKMLGRFRPDLYRERASVEHSGPGGGPIPMTIADVKAMLAANRLKPDVLAEPPTNGNGRA